MMQISCTFKLLIIIIINTVFTTENTFPALEKCALKVINFQMEPYAVVVSFQDSPLTNAIISKMQDVSYVLLYADEVSKLQLYWWRANLYIVIITEVVQYDAFLNLFHRSSVWNPRGMFFVIYLGNGSLTAIVQHSWKYYTLRTYILDKSLKIYSYFPYKYGKCGEDLQVEVVYTCEEDTAIDRIYSNNIPEQFNKCPFTFETIDLAPFILTKNGTTVGVEIEMLKEIAHYTNTTLVFLNHSNLDWGLYLINGNYIHLFGDLYKRKTNAIAGMVPASGFSGHFDRTFPHSFEKSVFFVPSGQIVERWRNFEMVYDKSVWLMLLTVFAAVSLFMWIGVLTQSERQNYGGPVYWALYVFCASFSSVPYLPRSMHLRYTIGCWLLSFFVLSSVYQCKLLTFLIKPAFEQEISSYEELIASGLPMGGYSTTVYNTQLETVDIELYRQLTKNWKNYSLTLECSNRVAEERNFVCLASYRAIQYQMEALYLHSNGVAKIKSLRDKRFAFSVSFYLDSGLPYYKRVEKIIRRLMENGLFFKWMDDYCYQPQVVTATETVKLNLHHFVLPFVILLAGHLTALCILLLEIVYCRIKAS